MIPAFLILLLMLGLIGGFFAGLVGIGGGIIMVPLLLYIPQLAGFAALDIKLVTGITMVQSLAGSLSALVIHRRNRFIHMPLVLSVGTGSVAGGLLGSVWSKALSGNAIMGIFVLLAVVAAVIMFIPAEEASGEAGIRMEFNNVLAGGIGLGTGFLGGIIGQGGAFLLIPLLLYVLKIPTRIALGSSVAIAFLSALAGFLGKLGTHQIQIHLALVLAFGAVLGAQAGGYLSVRVQNRTLRYVLGILIAGTALRMGYLLTSDINKQVSELTLKALCWFTGK